MLRIGFFYSLIIIAAILAGSYLIDLKQLFRDAFASFSEAQVVITFFISESILGWIPIDLFMIWTKKYEDPLAILTLLGTLSYLGGLVSYKIGSWIGKRERAKRFIERRLKKYIALTEKWGSTFIVVSALFPFSPFATVILGVSILKYPFARLALWGLVRIPKFVLHGLMLCELLDFRIG